MAEPFGTESLSLAPEEAAKRVRDNWLAVEQEVSDVAAQHGRDPSEVKIVGVTKYVDATITQWLIDAGCHELGENRPQHLWAKAELLGQATSTAETGGDQTGSIQWHQIGHLQRNKVRRLLRSTHGRLLVHAIDNAALLKVLADEAQRQECQVDVLIEINVSAEDAKTGLPIEDINAFWDATRNHVMAATSSASAAGPGVRIQGLMAMAGWGTDVSAAQSQFRRLRDLRDRLETDWELKLPELSMGMSGDFPAAIAEGATMVRIGSRLFAGLRAN